MNYRRSQDAFTLVELLVVISILAVLMAVAIANLAGARGRARDAKIKIELKELKNALRLYYNDYQSYPDTDAVNSPYILGCGTDHIHLCPNACDNEFSAGGTNCTDATVYMKRFPRGADGSTVYWHYKPYGATNDDFCLYTTLENVGDKEVQASWQRCATPCGTDCDNGTEYCVCAD